MSNYFSCILVGQGFVEKKWNFDKSLSHILQWCQICEGYKPPRVHHCRKCSRCVRKMDHHCPWINTCCGQYNQNYFTYFLFFAIIGCIHALLLLIYALAKIIKQPYGLYLYKRFNFYIVIHLFAIGLSIGVVIFVLLLLYFQLKNVFRNQTGIEKYIIKKINKQNGYKYFFTNPYDIGLLNNVKQTFSQIRFKIKDLDWPVKSGYTIYSLSIEQIKLKKLKSLSAVIYDVENVYASESFPLKYGIMTCILIPCIDEPRLSLYIGSQIRVTQWKKYWLYGEKVDEISVKGWFPKNCVKLPIVSSKKNYK